MQNDIIIKKPPASAVSESTQPTAEQADLNVKDIDEARPIEAVLPKTNAPLGIIATAIFICVLLITAAVYSAIIQA